VCYICRSAWAKDLEERYQGREGALGGVLCRDGSRDDARRERLGRMP
jgi:hypothetical protein